jgi:hypothetical protein
LPGCANPQPILVNGVDIGFVQCDGNYEHRVKAVNCATVPVTPGSCAMTPDAGALPASTCKVDSDCKSHPHGRCNFQPGGNNSFPGGPDAGTTPDQCGCEYAGDLYCLTDADCASGTICKCGDNGGVCINATCSLDSDCPAGAECLPVQISTLPGCPFGGDESFACQNTADECVRDVDCPPTASGGSRFCELDNSTHARKCTPITCSAGRPFLVAHEARLAPVRARGDWNAHDVAPNVEGLSAHARAALAAHWTETARMEHASIAAFARFALELLALGAPASLVERTHAAMADETAHARAAFSLASAYAGKDVGPGPLAIDGALGAVDARSVFATLAREGCVGETLAAVEATEAASVATDPCVREVLSRIARDETAHAELAWRAAGWLAASGDDAFCEWAQAELAAAIREREDDLGGASRTSFDGARGHGLLDHATKEALARGALRDIVAPLAVVLDRPVLYASPLVDGSFASSFVMRSS